MSNLRTTFKFVAGAAACILFAACASIGRPEGGPRDVTPPAFVRANPAPGARNVNRDRIELTFDENIQLDDAFNKVIVSPAQSMAPIVRSLGKRVTVELRDSLIPNTTYTIDFADAIKDLNEGNILDGFAMDFATGDSIDSLRISGIVLQAENLEPAQGITVGIHSNPTDTTLSSLPFERIARTNQYGQFTVRGLKPGQYGVYAIKDVNRDNRWDRSEDVAFLNTLVVPSAQAITVTDTLRNAAGDDSISSRPGVAYLPDDVLLTWFNENFKSQYLRNYTRPERRKVIVTMGAPSDTLPFITVAGGPLDGFNIDSLSVLQRTQSNDSLVYWLRDTRLLAIDSLMLSVRHEAMDSLDQIVWKSDTLKFFWRDPKVSKKEKNDTIKPHIPTLKLEITNNTQHEIDAPLRMKFQTPVAAIDTSLFHLEVTADTIWKPARLGAITPDPDEPILNRIIDFDRRPGMKYRLSVDTLAVTDIYGLSSEPLKHEFTVKQPEEYSNLIMELKNAGPNAIVQLLNSSDRPVKVATADDRGHASFKNITPGTYYARVIIDNNRNGRWDTGSVRDSLQPEEVYYYPKKLELRANWDVNQPWDIYELPLDAQKPLAIKANKPKTKAGEMPRDDEDIEYDEWGNPIDPADRYRNHGNRRNPNQNMSGGLRGIGGGFQQSSGNAATIRR